MILRLISSGEGLIKEATSIDDLINALLITAKDRKIKVNIFLICDNKSYSFNQILNIISKI